jgi:hypothetical protein
MIPNQWYPILEARALGLRPLRLRRAGHDFVLFRGSDGAPRLLLDRCSHRGAALSPGRVVGVAEVVRSPSPLLVNLVEEKLYIAIANQRIWRGHSTQCLLILQDSAV